MRRVLCLLLAAAACLGPLSACAPEERGAQGLALWFAADQSVRETATAALATQPYQGEGTIPALMQALLGGPEAGGGLASAIPAGTRLLDWSLEDGVAHVDLSQPYGDLVGVDLTLADYCITLTLTQLEEVEGVAITVNGSQPGGREGRVLYAGDVVLSGVEEEPVELSAALYFRRSGTQELGYELRVFQLTEDDTPALTVLEALLEGPQDEGLSPVLPQGLEIRSVRVENGVCYADFSARLLEGIPDSRAEQGLVVYSIINTLCSLDTVDGVQLLAEGTQLEEYGQLHLDGPLSELE
ncbi:MAG TPA: GerMN domain-containing protein [Candidatus Enterenecus stercoripullorum]|nr:GerMN domain-containing protein [Candidatus Enterenecus stercoripullorum]